VDLFEQRTQHCATLRFRMLSDITRTSGSTAAGVPPASRLAMLSVVLGADKRLLR
jgi:hypothetical protein